MVLPVGRWAVIGRGVEALMEVPEAAGNPRRSIRCELRRPLAGWRMRMGLADRLPAASDGRRQGAQSGQSSIEPVPPRPVLGEMQSKAACRASEPSGQGEEASSEGPGGHRPLAQTDARSPAGQVVCNDLDGHPGGVGGKAP